MDLETLPKKLNRTVYPSEIEALLVKERQARQDTNVPLSTQIITQIVSIFKKKILTRRSNWRTRQSQPRFYATCLSSYPQNVGSRSNPK